MPGSSGTACSTPAAWVCGMRPERHLGAVEELHGGGAADAAGAGGADRVAGVERVEIQLVGIGHAGRRRARRNVSWKRSTISNRFLVACSSWVRMKTR